jgi:hypothetical protein
MLASQAIHHQCQAPLGKKKITSIFYRFLSLEINIYLIKSLLSITVLMYMCNFGNRLTNNFIHCF